MCCGYRSQSAVHKIILDDAMKRSHICDDCVAIMKPEDSQGYAALCELVVLHSLALRTQGSNAVY